MPTLTELALQRQTIAQERIAVALEALVKHIIPQDGGGAYSGLMAEAITTAQDIITWQRSSRF